MMRLDSATRPPSRRPRRTPTCVHAAYTDVTVEAEALQADLEAFVADPTEDTLAAAKQSWLDARVLYGPTEAFRFYDGPIDNPDDGPEGQINAWPLDEAYIDYVEGDAAAGIINDTVGVPEITTDVLVAANEEGGESNISTGWHAIEFLLWGQDLSADGAGARPLTDYTTAPTAERRATYLTLLAELLVNDLERRARPVGSRGRGLPRDLPRRPAARPCRTSSAAWVPCRRVSSPASGSPLPTTPRTRKTSTPASRTTRRPTSPATPSVSG